MGRLNDSQRDVQTKAAFFENVESRKLPYSWPVRTLEVCITPCRSLLYLFLLSLQLKCRSAAAGKPHTKRELTMTIKVKRTPKVSNQTFCWAIWIWAYIIKASTPYLPGIMTCWTAHISPSPLDPDISLPPVVSKRTQLKHLKNV